MFFAWDSGLTLGASDIMVLECRPFRAGIIGFGGLGFRVKGFGFRGLGFGGLGFGGLRG